ncbi:hypothetical protein AWC35_14355 [Gibbsiella quercinecans]|uniref:Uncharacterized protein n=2 Tax=Gibbsiella quercinecans TaxID=929813 RepID=A0A250B2G5_9GAMM|nr:hypothetical protein AWC35_14355 [Gibbsiella quercinecans]RLM02678.1 hypothetical protein BIY31_23090 [Gibbsiella quercinecans]RLM10003.1 hypothetical protein BIY30_10775 [Gibbsiella quercinecans]
MRAKRQHPNLSPPGNLTFSFDTIKDNAIGEWSTGVEAIAGAERRNVTMIDAGVLSHFVQFYVMRMSMIYVSFTLLETHST